MDPGLTGGGICGTGVITEGLLMEAIVGSGAIGMPVDTYCRRYRSVHRYRKIAPGRRLSSSMSESVSTVLPVTG